MTPEEPVPQRIGFEERDAAVEALQEHHSLGRLDATEFEERMTKALQARTMPELEELFRDLPGPNPVAPVVGPQPALPVTLTSTQDGSGDLTDGAHQTPWYAQWWMILLAVGVTVVSDGDAGFIIPMMAIWLWIIYPSLAANSRKKRQLSQPAQAARVQQLPQWQRDRIHGELGRGRKIPAIKLYREYTGVGLREAKDAVEHMQRQIEG